MKHETIAKEKYLIVGLGNPDPEFENTLHNVGFKTVDEIAKDQGTDWKKSKAVMGDIAKLKFEDKELVLLKPLTYMNKSGLAVKNALKFWKIGLNNLLIVQDDSDIPMGRLKVGFDQSSGGHKGLDSIISALGNQKFSRIRLGVRPENLNNASTKHIKAEKFILHSYPKAKLDIISREGKDAVLSWLENGLAKTMTKYNSTTGVQ